MEFDSKADLFLELLFGDAKVVRKAKSGGPRTERGPETP